MIDGVLLPDIDEDTVMSDEEIKEMIINIVECKYGEAENNQKIDLLARVTGLKKLSDYIYWPDTVGLDLHASKEEIVTKVLEDMKRL